MKLLQFLTLSVVTLCTNNTVYSQYHELTEEQSQSLLEVMLHKYYTDAEISVIQTSNPEKYERLKYLSTQSFEVADSTYSLEQILQIDVNKLSLVRKRDEYVNYLDSESNVWIRLYPWSAISETEFPNAKHE